VLARGQRVKIGRAILPQYDHLAIKHETLLRKLQRGRDDQREAIGPVMAASTEQAHTVSIAHDHHPIAVIFNLVNPFLARGHLSAFVGRENGYSMVLVT
jgi:hypothetical protein